MSDYLRFLPLVTRQDVAGLLHKERTYKGSWKKGGGISAWFMVKRKLDRLEELMKRPEEPKDFNVNIRSAENFNHLADSYIAGDILAKIANEEDISGGKGLDGSVLAELRDLRRYMILIEAECYARGIIPCTDPPDDENIHARFDE